MLAVAEQAVDAALAAGARSAEAYAAWERGIGVAIEGGELKTAASGTEVAVGLRVLVNGKLGRASGGWSDLPAIARAAVAGALPAPEGFAFTSGGSSRAIVRRGIPPTAGVVDQTGELLEIAAARDVEVVGGGLGWDEGATSLATSEGLRALHVDATGDCFVSCVAEATVPGAAHASTWTRSGKLDLRRVATEAADHALGTRDPQLVRGKVPAIVFHPDALDGLLGSTLLPGLDAARQHRRESPLVTAEGPIAADGVVVRDVGPRADTLFVSELDDEGLPFGARDYIVDGALLGAVASLEDRARYGLATRGWALRAGGLGGRGAHGEPAASPGQLLLDAPRATLDEMLADAEGALYVRDVLGAHTANTTTGRFGVETTTAYLVEGGRLARPVTGALIGGTIVDLLRGIRLGTTPEPHSGWDAPGLLVGHVLVEGLPVTARGAGT